MPESSSSDARIVQVQQQRALATPQPVNDWQILGETFETMGKVGLAMTVGFSVAAAFCKMVDSGRIKLPKASTLMQLVSTDEPKAKETSTQPG